MADKKFLGLGFTFSATDKGLEKKLTSIKKLVSDISDGLESVNDQFSKMNGPKAMKKPSSSKSSSKRSSMAAIKKQSQPAQYENITKPRKVHIVHINQNVLDKIGKRFGKNLFKTGKGVAGPHQPIDVKSAIESWNTALENEKKRIEEATKVMNSFKVAVGAVKEYFLDLKSATNDFMTSLGVDFSKIIPDQFKSAFKLVTATIAGPFKIAKKVTSKGWLGKLTGFLKKQFSGVKSHIGGPGTKKRNLYQELTNIDENTLQKGDKLSLGGIAGAFKWLGKILGVGLLAKSGVKLFKFIAGIGPKLWEVISGIISDPIGALGKVFFTLSGWFQSGIKWVGEFFEGLAGLGTAVLAAFVLSAVFTGIAQGIDETWGEIKQGFSSLWAGISNLFSGIVAIGTAFIGNFDNIVKQFSEFSSPLAFALDLIVTILTTTWGLIRYGWKEITGLFGDLIEMITNKFGGWLFDLGKDLKKKADDISNIGKTVPTVQSPNVLKMQDYKRKFPDATDSDDLKDSLVQTSKDARDLQKKQISVTEQTLSKLDDLINATNGTKKDQPPLKIDLGFDAKKWGISTRQSENDQIGSGRT